MRLSDLPGGRLALFRDRCGIYWLLIDGRVRWFITMREAFAAADSFAARVN